MKRFSLSMFVFLGVVSTASMSAAQARVDCVATENGQPAAGTMAITRGGAAIGNGACGRPVTVPPGTYDVRVQVDGVLDRPDQTRSVTVAAGHLETVRVDFPTGILEVSVTSGGRRAAAQAVVIQNGREIGPVSAGVGAHLSVGSYDIVVRYRGQERRMTAISIAPSQRRTVSVEL